MKLFSTTISKVLTGLIAIALIGIVALTGGTTHALPYTGATTDASPVPAYDVFTPTVGNPIPAPAPSDGEQDFFQGRVPINGDPASDSTTPYSDPVNTTCTNGEIVQLRIYVHNGASADGNGANNNGPSVAHGTKVAVSLPTTTMTSFEPDATISANNAGTVSDKVTINCSGQVVQLQYVDGSASQFSLFTNTATPLSDSIVSGGVPISSDGVPGDVCGCWNCRVLVVLSVKVFIPPVQVPPTCNLLTLESTGQVAKIEGLTFTAGSSTVNGATIQFFNGSTLVNTAQLTPAQITALSHNSPLTYTFASTGNFLVKATVNTSLGNVTSNLCSATFTASTPPTPPVTPPTQLVNTGPGDVIGLFGLVTVAGAVAHRLFGKRFSRSTK
jgi:hypothetical protein